MNGPLHLTPLISGNLDPQARPILFVSGDKQGPTRPGSQRSCPLPRSFSAIQTRIWIPLRTTVQSVTTVPLTWGRKLWGYFWSLLPPLGHSPVACEILQRRNQVFRLGVPTFCTQSRHFTNVLNGWLPADTDLEAETQRS